MPHMVFQGTRPVEDYWRAFTPLLEKEGGRVLKAERCFLDAERTTALLEAFASEGGLRQKFFVTVGGEGGPGSATVRLASATDPRKTPGVQRLLAMVAEDFARKNPGARAVKHNLAPFLRAEIPGA